MISWGKTSTLSLFLYQQLILVHISLTFSLSHHRHHHQAPISRREQWIVLDIMITGTPCLGQQMADHCRQYTLLISIITRGHTCPTPILNPTTIMV
uniref:Uncharacterized protein n=1 Tax=Arundo donax TaxID=35708 RepID=A0A0A9GD59_ARUDO